MARKTFIGKVVGNKMKGTVIVEITRREAHPTYGKLMKKTKRFKAGAKEEIAVGKMVVISETRPVAKGKHFEVMEEVK